MSASTQPVLLSDSSADTPGPSPLPVARVRKVEPIRLVAIDLDGTLLDSRKRVSGRTVKALRALPELGVHVVIASARPPRGVRQVYEKLRLTSWQVNYNGALIWDESSGRVVYHRPLAGALVRNLVAVARATMPDVLVSCEVLDRWHTDRDVHTYTTETGKLFRPDVIAPIDVICATPVTKLMLLGDPVTLPGVATALAGAAGERVSVLHVEPDLIQVMHRKVGKGAALGKVARHYGVPARQTLAIGDAPNDLGMLRWAGIAVAMGNGHDAVKQVADWVAPCHDDHGVFATLQKYGLVE